MIWIGTSGWSYPHWKGNFYPSDLPARSHLAYYARHFPTVEINRSFYRLPPFEQFQNWSEQVKDYPGFLFCVKASRYITHLKKLEQTDEGVQRLQRAASGLGKHLGPFLSQLPPHWRANVPRLERFLSSLPPDQRVSFEFRDPSWFSAETLKQLQSLFQRTGTTVVISIAGGESTPPELAVLGSFHYLRFHHGSQGVGFTEAELAPWSRQLLACCTIKRDAYVSFNNDPQGHAIANARRLRRMIGKGVVEPESMMQRSSRRQ